MSNYRHRATLAAITVLAVVTTFSGAWPKSASDSDNWNDYENYSTSDWGPVVNGVSIRVTAPRELSFGVPITMLLERRIYSDQLPTSIKRWSPDASKMKFQLDIYDSDDCPGECTQRYSFGSNVSHGKQIVSGSLETPESTPLVVEFRPDPPKKPRLSILGRPVFDDAPTFPLTPGNHQYRVKLIVSDSAAGCWHGVAETFFRLRTGPELVVRKSLVVIVPHALEIRSQCTFGMSSDQLDTLILRPRFGDKVWAIFRLMNVTKSRMVCEHGDTDRFTYSEGWPINVAGVSTIPDGFYYGPVFLSLSESDGSPPHIGATDGPVLWSRDYVRFLTPEQMKAVDSCRR
jgi:hypothetical protein